MIGHLTLSILNPSSLMLTEFQKSPTSFDSFEKGVSLRSRPSSRRQPGTLETSPLSFPNKLSTSGHTLRGPRMARPTTKRSGKTETSQKTRDSLRTFAFTIRSTEFASKKEGNACDLQTSSWISSHQDTCPSSPFPRYDHILVFYLHYYIFSSSRHASSMSLGT